MAFSASHPASGRHGGLKAFFLHFIDKVDLQPFSAFFRLLSSNLRLEDTFVFSSK
jgi:hypothetical protein